MLAGARAQVWRYAAQYRRPRHFHLEPELNLVGRGEAVLGVGEAVVEARAGDLLCFAPGQDHVLLHASPDLELFSVGIAPALLADVGSPARGDVVLPVRTRLSSAEAALLVPLAAGLADRMAPAREVLALWSPPRSARRVAATSGEPLHELTRRALAVVSRHPELDRTTVARLGRTCPSEIGRYFRRDVGLTLVDYRTRLRLLRFIEHVDRGDGDLLRAALDAGFGSYSQLHRAFRAALGCGPRRFFAAERPGMEGRFEPASG